LLVVGDEMEGMYKLWWNFFDKASFLDGANCFDTSIVLAPLWLEWQ
jgi:hypothetical protein